MRGRYRESVELAAFGPHSTWSVVGFRNKEPEGILSFDNLDPIPVTVRNGALVRACRDDLGFARWSHRARVGARRGRAISPRRSGTS